MNTNIEINNQKLAKKSYSQSGEDLIIKYIFNALGIESPSYIDVGAHHPYYLNNTALFYELGSKGINIEPDPTLFKNFLKARRNDINLNLGIGESAGEFDFYIMNTTTLNTFSRTEAKKYSDEGNYFIKDIIKIPVLSFNEMISKYFNKKYPDFITIDAEGVDEIILKSIDYSTNYPIVICVETISFSNHGKGIKNEHLIEFIKSNGYLLYADTYINSIFVKETVWTKININRYISKTL
jgi:FkbM family methyltransferase